MNIDASAARTAALRFLEGGGEMGALIREKDWSDTAFGPPETWPRSLRTAIRIMLTSRQPIWIGWGPELIFFYNDPYKSIIGGKHPSALGQPTRIVWQEIWHEIEPMLDQAMRGVEGTYVEEQLLIMKRNGYPEETYYTFSYSPIPDDDGEPGGIICANTDDTRRVIGERQLKLLRDLAAAMTETRTVEHALRLSAEALGANAQDIPLSLIYAMEDAGRAARLAGFSGIDPGHPSAPARIAQGDHCFPPLEKAFSDREIQILPAESFGTLPTGPWRIELKSVAVVPLGDSGETGQGSVLILGLNPFRLVDDDYIGFLNLIAGQISSGLANAEAYEAERRRAEALAEIDRAKTLFFSNISHEFRTPLALMLGPIEELRLHLQETDVHGDGPLVDILQRNGQRLLRLVNNLLDFSRLEAGRMSMHYEPTDLAAFTADLASTFRSVMEKAGLDFRVEGQQLDAMVYVDRASWEKIVLNLVSNAFKFTLNGTVSVGVAKDGEGVVLTVADTGTGIRKDYLPHLFERFFRIEGSEGRTLEGSGIGLALVQELVHLHGGTIEVESEIGKGTCFTVRIPLGNTHLPQQMVGEGSQAAAASERRSAFAEEAARWLNGGAGGRTNSPIARDTKSAGGECILVVDDNADLREYMMTLLSADGYEVLTAADGLYGLDIARAHRPALILSDIMMPRLDGLGLLSEIRKDPALRDTPFLLLSAKAGEEAEIEGIAAGADDYLVKPFSARTLSVKVASNLQLAEVRRETERLLRADARTLEILNEVGAQIAGELDLSKAVQLVTDAATELTGAAFGSFFYNVVDEQNERYTLYTLSGVPKDAFSKFPMPRNTAVFAPTFSGTAIVRSADITRDPRFGRNDPHYGMPDGHLPVRSYLAAPVKSRTGEVLGGLFFGHPEIDQFDAQHERLIEGIAGQAAIAIDNARLFQAAQTELAERRKAEQALRELNETLEQRVSKALADRDRLWELSEDLLVIADFDGHFVRLSPSWTRLLGYGEAELLERPYTEILHPDEIDGILANFEELRTTGRPIHFENRVLTAAGNWRWFSWTVSNDPDQSLLHGVGRDITADKEAEEAMRQAEAAMRSAQKMEAIGNLTGGVAHDFNNLLQVIGGNLQLLVKEVGGNDKAETRLRNALAGVTRGSKLASQLLSFGRRQPLAPKVVNLGRFIRSLDEMLRRTLGEGIEIETVISGGLWNTLVDPFQVENALLNLAINARDAMKGHGRLTIEAGNAYIDENYASRNHDVTPGQYVMCAVTDTGSGMSPEVIERVFEPFFTTKPEGQGTGLGLSMVYGFIRQSEGHIKIYSEENHGTTIRFYLPRSKQDEDRLSDTETGPILGGSETVLVVEDDEDVRATVVDMLSDLGYRVLKAKDASSGLAIIESGIPVDVLFTDVVMPGPLRSPELARKARERLPGIAVLFTSGYTDNAIVHAGRLDEGVELLSKPYRREDLARRLRHVIGRQQQPEAAANKEGAQAAPVPAPPAPRPARLRILVAEDEPFILMDTADMLRDLGHEVFEAGNGKRALEMAAENQVDVLLTDIHLPDMSGIAVSKMLQSQDPALRIIFASGLRPDLSEAPGASFVIKPYSQRDLERVLNEAYPHQEGE